jgi:hypothetical protein
MPVLAALAAIALALVASLALMPLSLVLRYRASTARRVARGWVAALNVGAIASSAALLLAGAAVTSAWVPHAFPYAVAGMATGGLLGFLGLALTRWEAAGRTLHYTPNRWLVLAVLLVVTARLAYGFWRAWHAWHTTPGEDSWLAASGAAGSLAAGALVVGYYGTYWAGVWRRFAQHRRRFGVIETTIVDPGTPLRRPIGRGR